MSETAYADTAAHIAAENALLAGTPAVETPKDEEKVIEAEADSGKPDADLSEAGRTLRMNRADKRAERIRHENDELARELHRRSELRSELERFATAQPATAGATSTPAGSTDQKDPEPTFDAYRSAHPDDPDPYTGWVREHNRWAAREEIRIANQTSHASRQRASETQAAQAVMADLAQRSDHARGKFSDYDAVIEPVITAIASNPQRERDVTAFVLHLPKEVSGEVMYRLGKDKAALQAVLSARNRTDLTRALLDVERAITPPKPEAQPKTTAAAPMDTTGGGSTATETLDTRKGVPLKDHIRIEEAEIADRRKRGYRY